ncbi:unnamed protein product [Pleuronectes platessa]|uniref:Uncharacterized protein n=1 Tax=Pleuronectes platessa TaxID=8262 RepID=A0A9N7Z3Y2_PLEPL|nr:unnamed protein product [Pleuronectes platessa]
MLGSAARTYLRDSTALTDYCTMRECDPLNLSKLRQEAAGAVGCVPRGSLKNKQTRRLKLLRIYGQTEGPASLQRSVVHSLLQAAEVHEELCRQPRFPFYPHTRRMLVISSHAGEHPSHPVCAVQHFSTFHQ